MLLVLGNQSFALSWAEHWGAMGLALDDLPGGEINADFPATLEIHIEPVLAILGPFPASCLYFVPMSDSPQLSTLPTLYHVLVKVGYKNS